MRRFDSKGMMVFPNPMTRESICKSKKIVVVKACYCQNGHSLVSERAVFNGFQGIVFKVKNKRREGLVALSPVYGYKSRVSLDADLEEGEIWEVRCPVCDVELPVFSECSCGGSLLTLFADQKADFNHCIVICNRIGCFNAGINQGSEMLALSMHDRP